MTTEERKQNLRKEYAQVLISFITERNNKIAFNEVKTLDEARELALSIDGFMTELARVVANEGDAALDEIIKNMFGEDK